MSLSILPAALAAVLVSGAMQPAADTGLPPLSLAEALLIAESREEPGVQAWRVRAEALETRGEAESALPDPSVRIGVASVPLSDFDLEREAMTQAQGSVRQMFPRGETRRLQRARREAEAEGARAGMALQVREIRRMVRQGWNFTTGSAPAISRSAGARKWTGWARLRRLFSPADGPTVMM